MTSMLELAAVTASRGSKTVLHPTTLQLPKGEMLSLLGPSGCGKTTLLNVVSGFLPIDSGEVRINGEDVTTVPDFRRDVTMVFQSYALFPHLTVFQNVAYGLRVRKMTKSTMRERVANSLALVGLVGVEDRYPSQLSGGQQQRVAVARAIAIRPSVLLLDEPLSNLDAKLRDEVRAQLRSLQLELGQSAVFVTHDQSEALAVSDHIALLNEGRIVQFGTPHDLYTNPVSVFAARFMGFSNILDCAVDGHSLSTTVGLRVPFSGSGQPTSLAFRASNAALVAEQPDPGDNYTSISVEVADATYLGGTIKYVVRPTQSRSVELQVEMDSERHAVFAKGAEGWLRLRTDEISQLGREHADPDSPEDMNAIASKTDQLVGK